MTAVHSDDLELLERLGGTDATVHRAMVRTTGRVVVVKQAPWDRPDIADRLGRESAVLGRVQHASLVRLLDHVDDEDGRTLVLAHAPGGSLADRLERHGPLPASEVADIGARLAEALAALHRAGVIHRDLHPANVVVDAELQPVLADLDHALDQRGGHLPSDDEVVGHPAHVDPRLFSGVPAGPASDLHALATTLWTVATGTPPPRGGPDQPVHLPPDERVPPVLREVLDDCLHTARDAAATATSLHAAAAQLLSDPPGPPTASTAPTESTPSTPTTRPPPPPTPPGPLAALPPPVASSTGPSSTTGLVAGTGEGSTRRWGPVPGGQRSLGGPADRPLGRGVRRHVVPALLVLAALLVGGWLLATAMSPDEATPPSGGAAPVAVEPPPACPDAPDPADAVAAPAGTPERGRDAVLADLDGDGCSEALWLVEGVLHAPGGRYRVGEVGDVLVAGDWDGDGAWGVGLYRPGTGEVFLFDGAPGPGLRSRPAERLDQGGTPIVVDAGTSHHVVLALGS